MTLPSDRLPTDLRALGQRVVDLERTLRELRASRRLEHATVSGSIKFLDASGNVAAKLGQQTDGTVALAVTAGPTPPVPTDPVVTAELAALGVTWDGEFVGGVGAPADWLRVEVHVSDVSGFTPSQATLRQTIETPQGATVLVPLPYVEQYVRLRSCTTSGAVSAPTGEVSGTPRQAAADDIAADAITGKVITGGTFQTSEDDPALVITDDGYLRVYDGGGGVTFQAGGNGTVLSPSGTGVTADLSISNGVAEFGHTDGTYFSAQILGELGGNSIQLAGGYPDDGAHANTRLRLVHGAVSGTSGRPVAAIDSAVGDGRADLTVSGNATAAALAASGTVQTGSYLTRGTTWQTPSYAANWSGNTGMGTSTNWGTLKIRLDGEDNVWLIGGFKAASGAGLTVLQLPNTPINYRPNAQWPVAVQQRTSGGANTLLYAQISASGNLNLVTQTGLAVAAGTEYLINAKVPLGNLT